MTHTWSWKLLRAGMIRLDGGGMFGVVPKPIWSTMTPPDDANRIPLQTNCLLLEDGSQRVLIETGFGDKWSDKERDFYDLERRSVADAITETELSPDDIDAVILTHLHFDHAAGLTTLGASGEPVSVFPNARIIVQQTEWNDALANKSTMSRTYLRSHLDPVTDQVQPVDGPGKVLPGISVVRMPGHTWGHQGICFDDGDGTVCFPGDVMPTRHHVGLAFNMGYDVMPYQNVQTKQELLTRAAGEGWRIVLDHEPGNPVVRVTADSDRPGRFTLEDAET